MSQRDFYFSFFFLSAQLLIPFKYICQRCGYRRPEQQDVPWMKAPALPSSVGWFLFFFSVVKLPSIVCHVILLSKPPCVFACQTQELPKAVLTGGRAQCGYLTQPWGASTCTGSLSAALRHPDRVAWDVAILFQHPQNKYCKYYLSIL